MNRNSLVFLAGIGAFCLLAGWTIRTIHDLRLKAKNPANSELETIRHEQHSIQEQLKHAKERLALADSIHVALLDSLAKHGRHAFSDEDRMEYYARVREQVLRATARFDSVPK